MSSTKFVKHLRIATARAKNAYFRSFEGFQGRWGYRGHMLRNVRAKPRETAATGVFSAARTVPQRERHVWPDVRRRPCQTAARVELWARKRTAPQGERQQNGDLRPRQEVRSGILRASEGPKNALRTAGKPTPTQKWSETCLPKKNWAFFVSTQKLFANFSRPRLAHRRRQSPNTKTAETKRFAISEPGPKTANPTKPQNWKNWYGAPIPKKRFFCPICPMNTKKKARKRNFLATFRTSKKKTKPLFL